MKSLRNLIVEIQLIDNILYSSNIQAVPNETIAIVKTQAIQPPDLSPISELRPVVGTTLAVKRNNAVTLWQENDGP